MAAARERGRPTGRIYAALLVYAGILAALVAVAVPYRVGDGPEYMGMAQSMARLEIPIVNDPVTVEGRFNGWSGWDRARLTNLLEMPDGRFAYSHLWTYPLLVAAPMAAVEAAGLHPNLAFTITNGLLLLAAAAVALPRIGIGWSALLFIGPIVWWVDKAHNEIFTFAFLVIAFSVYRQRPGIALVAIGAAASNYLPLAALLPAFAAFAVWRDRPVARMPSFWTGAAIGVALAALNPLFYLATLGRPIPLLGPYGHLHIPTMAEIGVPLWDLNMGLVTNFPALVVAVVVALALIARDGRLRAIRWDLVLVAAVAVPMIVGASQPWNLHTGGTFGMSRYGIWFIPLAIPVLRALGAVDRRPVFLGLVAASVVFTLWLAAPSTKHNPLQPNYAARRVWEHLPALENPLPEVFFETMAGREGPPFESQAGPGCAKVLVIDGVWPSSCPLPAVEIPPSGYWYANREPGTYTFVTAPLPGQRFDDASTTSRTPRPVFRGSRSP